MCECDIEPIVCGGCALIIREVEEGVWVRAGSDECEAGGVHAPPAELNTGGLAEIYLIRFPEGDGLVKPLWWSDTEGAVELSQATVYHIEDPSLLPPHAVDGEWVRFVECPF